MPTRPIRPARRRTMLLLGVCSVATVSAGLMVGPAVGAGAGAGVAQAVTPLVAPVRSGTPYLALGDSVVFGYREPTNRPTPDYTDPGTFVGYPEDVGAALHLTVANASCPGETSSSLQTAGAQSNGCENSLGSDTGYRTAFPLHTDYAGTQLAYAKAFLHAHRDTSLVTLMVGANDGFLCQRTTTDHCLSEIGALAKQVNLNVKKIITSLRYGAHYKGQLVVVNYYSLDYSNVLDNAASLVINQAIDGAAKPYYTTVADGYGAFQAAAAQAGGNACTAGLLTQLTGGGCGVHPSVAGQAALALAVEKAIQH